MESSTVTVSTQSIDDQFNAIASNDGSNATVVEDRIRRPPNAFMIFGSQHRKLLAQKFPQYTNKQISKILGEEWKSMSADSKAHYHRLADDKHRQHLDKYPGYYYSPLEARIRKAERKRNSKSMRKSRKNQCTNDTSNANTVTLYGQIDGFRDMRSMIGSNQMVGSAMFAPQLMPYMRARLPSVANIRYYGPDHPFGGFVPQIRKLRPTLPSLQPPMHVYVMPVYNEHNYSSNTQSRNPSEHCTTAANAHKDIDIDSDIDCAQTGKSDQYSTAMSFANSAPDLNAIMSEYLPPMSNPLIEVTAVVTPVAQTPFG